jgi:hypothetical protein
MSAARGRRPAWSAHDQVRDAVLIHVPRRRESCPQPVGSRVPFNPPDFGPSAPGKDTNLAGMSKLDPRTGSSNGEVTDPIPIEIAGSGQAGTKAIPWELTADSMGATLDLRDRREQGGNHQSLSKHGAPLAGTWTHGPRRPRVSDRHEQCL